jgi:LAS superfamily LD-carboxypeptidase LdcB
VKIASATATRYGLGAASTTTDGLLLATLRGITVNARIDDQTVALLAAAEVDGIRLAGGGYRSHQQQIALRQAHCGPSPYDVYLRPAGQCRPPTARPGQSRHEQGLAIDVTCDGHLIVSRRDRCFLWLEANAHRFGFTGISSEAWHWEARTGRGR